MNNLNGLPINQISKCNRTETSSSLFFCCTVLDKVREQIKARGAKTIRGLGRTFRNFDSFDGNHKIDKEEFYSGLCEIQVQVTKAEAMKLMELFDTDGDGYVNFDEFLVGIRVSKPLLTQKSITSHLGLTR